MRKSKEKKSAGINFQNTEIAFSALDDRALWRAKILFQVLGQSWLVKSGPVLADFALQWKLPVQGLIRKTIFSQFCGGETIEACLPKIKALHQHQIGTILDFAREGGGSETELDAIAEEILKTIAMAARFPQEIPFAVFKPTAIVSIDVLTRFAELGEEGLDQQEALAWRKGLARMERICQRAFDLQVPVMIDAEESWFQKAVDDLALEFMKRWNRSRAIVFNTVQLYRHDRLPYLKDLYQEAQKSSFIAGVKLVRGAYLEKERARAAQRQYPSPINATKAATDREYDEALRFCVEHIQSFALCAGTHNEASLQLLVSLLEEKGLAPDDPRVSFAQLLGMSDNLSYNLAHAGFRVAKYMPYGSIEELLPYLTRRAQENSSVMGQTSRELQLLQKEELRRKKLSRSS